MKNVMSAWMALFLLILAGLSPVSSARAADEDKAGVMKAQSQFYAALNEMFKGDLDQMKEVWSHADDVVYLGPDNKFLVGWGDVSKNWEMQAARKLGGKVEAVNAHMYVGKDMAVVYNYENGENTNANGEVVKVSIRATNVFRKEGGKWKMIGHHTDLLPFLQK